MENCYQKSTREDLLGKTLAAFNTCTMGSELFKPQLFHCLLMHYFKNVTLFRMKLLLMILRVKPRLGVLYQGETITLLRVHFICT